MRPRGCWSPVPGVSDAFYVPEASINFDLRQVRVRGLCSLTSESAPRRRRRRGVCARLGLSARETERARDARPRAPRAARAPLILTGDIRPPVFSPPSAALSLVCLSVRNPVGWLNFYL